MRTVNVHAAKTHFSQLLADVAAGEEVIIAKAGKPIAKLIAIEPPARRPAGLLEGQFTVPDDFDTMFDDDIQAMFGGSSALPEPAEAAG